MKRHYDQGNGAGAPRSRARSFGTVIARGGQAGLSMGYHLARLGQSCVILEEHGRMGDG
jgi:putative flavoprotein involved in K+ transport